MPTLRSGTRTAGMSASDAGYGGSQQNADLTPPEKVLLVREVSEMVRAVNALNGQGHRTTNCPEKRYFGGAAPK